MTIAACVPEPRTWLQESKSPVAGWFTHGMCPSAKPPPGVRHDHSFASTHLPHASIPVIRGNLRSHSPSSAYASDARGMILSHRQQPMVGLGRATLRRFASACGRLARPGVVHHGGNLAQRLGDAGQGPRLRLRGQCRGQLTCRHVLGFPIDHPGRLFGVHDSGGG